MELGERSNLTNIAAFVAMMTNESIRSALDMAVYPFSLANLAQGKNRRWDLLNRHPRKKCERIETSPSQVETLSKNRLRFRLDDMQQIALGS